jgi:hypothetical protein
MYALCILLATSLTGVLYAASFDHRIALDNRTKVREAARMAALVVVWGIIASAFISLLLPSPWS